MRKRKFRQRLVSILLAVLMAFTGIAPAASAFAADGVEGYYDIELFYKETDTIVPSTMLNDKNEEVNFVQYMVEGDELELTYKLIDTEMPDNGYIRWFSETPTLVDVNQEGVVKAFDSSKGAVIHSWIDNEVRTIPLVGDLIAKAIEKVLFNEYVDVDTMDTEAIIALVEDAFGSDSLLAKWVDSYKGELIDSLRYYLDNINSNVHVQLYDADGTLLDDDYVQICVTKNEAWYANFLPNGTHITNKSQINTTVAVGSTVQLYAITTPVRLQYGCVYSVKSSSIFDQGKVVATVDDSGLVTFKNKGTVTIMVSPDSEQVIQNILKLVNYFYTINTDMIDTKELADILIKYVGIDMNRNVLAALLDACFIIADIAGDSADPVKLSATAVKIIANLVLQFKYNDTITFTVVDAQPITDFKIDGASTVKEGTQIKLSIVDVQPTTGDVSDITWYSSNPSVASVDPKTGVITGRDAGGSLGALSTNECTIYAVSAANNIEKSHKLTVTGKTGKYLSDAEILGEAYLEMGMETDYSYCLYPSRVAESDNLYVTWGMVTGVDEEGETTYSWADAENPATDGRGVLDSRGHYTVVSGGISQIALKAQTGYYLSNGHFYEISSLIKLFEVTNGIPVEAIQLTATDSTGIFSNINKTETVNINGQESTYVSVKAGTQYGGLGAVINASVYPANASNQRLTWVVDNDYYEKSVSDDTHTATIKQNLGHENADTFNVYAVSADGSVKSNVITVCVSKNNVTANTINQSSISVIRGKTADATHTISFDKSSDGTYSACYKCNWYSSDESIFTVETKRNDNRDGTVKGVDVGTATLYCVSADGGFIDTCQVTVYPDKDYLRNIVKLCDKTVIKRTKDNAAEYKKYMNKLDLAYAVLYDQPMASQTTCDTYADELLYAFYKLGGFVGILGVNITDKGGKQMSGDYVTVNVGSTTNYTKYSYEFDFDVLPKNAMYSSVTWESSNASVRVDKNGVCKPASNDACCAVITCTVADYMGATISDSVCIAFSRTPATGVTLNTESIVGGKIGETQKLTATVSPTGTIGIGEASNKAVLWTSSDESIATVDANGVVSFLRGGDCVITATTIDGGHKAHCAVNVVTNYTNLQLLVQQYTDLSLNSVNYYPDTWEVYTNAMTKAQNIINRANSSQDEVDAMYAELENAYNSLQKYNYIQRIELYLDGEQTQEFYQYDLSLLSEGISYKNAVLDLNIRLYPNNGSYESVQWVSSTDEISVTSDGKCSPTVNKSCYGMITCTVTDHYGNAFTDSVWVSYSYFPVTSLDLSTYNISGSIGDTCKLACTVQPTGTSIGHIGAASIQDYYWESDDESVATVSSDGIVTFTGAGATIVRAVSYDGGISAECRVSTEGDRSALMQALEDYKDINYSDYEYSYGVAFQEAYQEAQKALNDISYTQERIDAATNNLVSAYNAMVAHPYVYVSGINVTYTTTKDPTFGSASQVASGTVGSSDALSVNLSKNYADYNYNNWATLTAAVAPSNAMYKSLSWSIDSSYKVKTAISDTSIKITPDNGTKNGAWAIITATAVDNYNRTTTRTIYVTLSDKVCTGFDITESSRTMYATASPYQIPYTLSGSPEFTTVLWSSSDPSVASVDGSGKVTPVDKGTATIVGKTLDGGYTDTITITVQADYSALAAKQNTYYNLIQEVKDNYTYTEESLGNLAEVVSEAQVMINEGKASQAEVNNMITRLDDAYNSLVIYVPVTSVKISAEDEEGVTVVKDGYIRYAATVSINNKTVSLVPVFNDESAVYTQLTWSSSSNTITVDQNGLVKNTSANAGVAEITCTVKNVFGGTCSAKAYVTFTRSAVTGVSFSDTMVYGAPAQSVTVTPSVKTATNTSSNLLSVKECIFTSSDPSVATVDETGKVTFISQGNATITATTKDGGYTATITAFTTWDTTALKAAITRASDITYTDYSVSYGLAFKNAYEDALEVYENIYASQQEIDAACMALTEAMNALEGNEFISPVVTFVQNGTALENNALVQVDDAHQAAIAVSLNANAMIKSRTIATSDPQGVTAIVSGNTVVITKTAETGKITIDVTTVDDYDREQTVSYTFNIIDQMICATSIVLTANGNVVGDTYTQGYTGTYSNFTGITFGYITTPANANCITNVTYTSSASEYVTIDNNGVIALTTRGKIRSSNTSRITCTVTNADGSTATASVNLTITKS